MSEPNYCGKCGAQLKPSAKFCANCGAAVALADVRKTAPEVSGDRSSTQARLADVNDDASGNVADPVSVASARSSLSTAFSVQRPVPPEPSKGGFLWVAKMFGLIVLGLIVWLFLYAQYDNYRNRSKGGTSVIAATTVNPSVASSQEKSAPSDQMANSADELRIEPTLQGLKAFVQSIEGKQVPVYFGKEKRLYFFVKGGQIFNCNLGYRTESDCAADSATGGSPYIFWEKDGFSCLYSEHHIAQNLATHHMLCVVKESQVRQASMPMPDGNDASYNFNAIAGEPYYAFATSDPDNTEEYKVSFFSLYPSRPVANVENGQSNSVGSIEDPGAAEDASVSDDAPVGCEAHRSNQTEALTIVNDLKSQDGTQQIAGNFMRSRLNEQGVSDECIQYLAKTFSLK